MSDLRYKVGWGDLIEGVKFKDYEICEYFDPFTNDNSYHIYLDGKDMRRPYSSFDEALIGALCLKYDGLNTQADTLIAKMLGL